MKRVFTVKGKGFEPQEVIELSLERDENANVGDINVVMHLPNGKQHKIVGLRSYNNRLGVIRWSTVFPGADSELEKYVELDQCGRPRDMFSV